MTAILTMFKMLWIVVLIAVMSAPPRKVKKVNDYIEQRTSLVIISNLLFWGSFGLSAINIFN